MEADMAIDFKFSSFVVAAAVAGTASMVGCTTDDGDTGGSAGASASTGGSAASGAAGKASSGGPSGAGSSTGGAPAGGNVCAAATPIKADAPGIADFDAYDGVTELAKWSFPLGGDSASGVYAGPFGYGDREGNLPETLEMADGDASMYALRIADTLAEKFGGGAGLWLSACLDASKLSGISFWVRGDAPKGEAKLTLSMGDTTPAVPAKADDKPGSCSGDAMTCVHPTFGFPVTDAWTEVKVPWTSFTPGDAAGTPVTADGSNITQIQFAVELNWVADDAGVYMPTPAPYELAVDTLSFY
jgi:hypothetical protein